ncbi:MAG: hypothetical protein NVS9B7_00470 [Flavisolibacter sp.]
MNHSFPIGSVLCMSLFLLAGNTLSGQNSSVSFVNFQRTLPRPSEALKHKEDTLRRQFESKGLTWPAKFIYIRSFKLDSQMELWVKNIRKEPYKLFKTYRVCALAGTLGPKRMAGDYQVPEGFYYINEFNATSNYYLSLGLNYPNVSDRILSDSLRPGGDIYIHGSCVTVGCIPITDQQIEEIYILAAYARDAGQEFIPVHIYPIRYSNKTSQQYLSNLTRNDGQLKLFAEKLQSVYDHFELTHQLPVIMTNNEGEYTFDGLSKKLPSFNERPKHAPFQHRTRNVSELVSVVNKWPEFPGGGAYFLKYLEKIGTALIPSLPEGTKKAHVIIEFIIDKDGTPTNFKVIKGVDEYFDEGLIKMLEQMPLWQPAILNDKPVAKKMKQSFEIG